MRSFLGRGPLPGRVDVTIIGGGVSGVALARECARARKSVLLLEREDFGSGTTSRCTRVIEGGLQYLERGELSLLRESLHGRETLLREQPHLVEPLEFALAVGPAARYSSLEIRAALWLYRKLGRIPASDSDEHVSALRRNLRTDQPWSIYSYQDAVCDFPERLVADWLIEACAEGTTAHNHAEVLAIRASEGRVRGVLVRDLLAGKDSYVESDWVINASGPWVDRVRDLTDLAPHTRLVSGMRSTHIMLRRWPDAPNIGLHTKGTSGQSVSIAPWNGMIQAGFTEIVDGGDPALAQPGANEIASLFNSVAALFPNAHLCSSDIVFSYAGVRPFAYAGPKRADNAALKPGVCRHVLYNHADEGALGMLSIFGGNLTTAATLARNTAKTMGLAPGQHSTHQVAIGEASGVESTLQHWSAAVHAVTGIPQKSAEAVARWHGRHAMCVIQTAMHIPAMRMPLVDGRPQLVAQGAEAVAYEHAVTLGDILLRRVPMALDQHWDENCTGQAASRLAPALNWNERRVREEIEAFEEERSRFLQKPKNLRENGVAA